MMNVMLEKMEVHKHKSSDLNLMSMFHGAFVEVVMKILFPK